METAEIEDVCNDFMDGHEFWIPIDARYSVAILTEDMIYDVILEQIEQFNSEYSAPNLADKYEVTYRFHGGFEVDLENMPYHLAGTYYYDSDEGDFTKVEG